MGRLLGDPEVWDDSPSRPRVLLRGLVGLGAGLVAGSLVAFAVVPRPPAPPPEIAVPPPPAEAPRVRVEQQTLYNVALSAGPLLVTRSGRLEVAGGEVIGLVGPSGSGKSTTLLLLAGLEPPDAGVVRLDGEDLAGLGERGRQALRRDRMALVFQGYGLLSLLTARENVELPFRVARRNPGAATAAAGRWLGLLGLADRVDQRTDELSGGERQRVALARAFAVEPEVLLVDEPTAELDEDSRERTVGLLRDAADRGAAVVVATHDPDVVDLCDRVVRLVDGRPTEPDPPPDPPGHPRTPPGPSQAGGPVA